MADWAAISGEAVWNHHRFPSQRRGEELHDSGGLPIDLAESGCVCKTALATADMAAANLLKGAAEYSLQ